VERRRQRQMCIRDRYFLGCKNYGKSRKKFIEIL
jgi:hypothetical protein